MIDQDTESVSVVID